VSAAALERGAELLRGKGVAIRTPAAGGYGLARPVELLDARQIRAMLREERERRLRQLEVLFEIDSTNTRLLERPAPPEGAADVCLSELQHAGRGRRGRRWIAPFGDSIAMSIGWAFRDAARASPALSLAVGVAIARAAERAGARGVRLKWPNDIWFEDRKVGGVLLELRAETAGAAHVVIGVGLNVSLSRATREELEQSGVRVAALADACEHLPSRNAIAGLVLDEILGLLAQFAEHGFTAFRAPWAAIDALRDRPAEVSGGAAGVLVGTARGVDEDGALLLESGGRLHRFVSGEVSLRGTAG
jgi:BirA family biotin operon repressor/biotin-[acetyl-CoA-carboxylase] ligase